MSEPLWVPFGKLVDEHIPSLSDADDAEMDLGRFNYEVDNADLALRTCRCGVRIDGFYEYVDHLKAMARKEWS